MSLGNIEKSILASAEAEARQLTESAQADARAEIERLGARLREEHQRHLAAAKAEADAAAERDTNTHRAGHAMKLLKAKNDTLEAVFSSVRDHALACEGFDYPRWLAAQVRRACATGVRGTLLCAQRDRQAVEALLRQAGAGGITLAPTPGSMRGGVYLEGEGVDLDLTLDAALADLRDELAMSLAQRLFGDVPALSDAGPAPGD